MSRSASAPVSPARLAAFAVVRRVFEEGAYADRALASEAAGLEQRERSLATRIAYGTVQRRATLDHVAERLVRSGISSLEAPVLAALRIGLYQLIYLDGIPDHAAVAESVELAKRSSRGGAGLVNAVLRRAASERERLLGGLDDGTPSAAAVMHSVPEWLADMWFEELGAEDARALLARINQPAESAVRVNTLVATVGEVTEELNVGWHPADGLPEGVVLEGPFDLEGSELWRRGAVMGQSRASMLVARTLAPEPGDRVLDLCAAPGGKTTHCAALVQNNGIVVAVERHEGRAAALQRTAARMGASCVSIRVADAREPLAPEFDRVLVDPPCSGLGTLQSRPDRRWRVSAESVGELASLQGEILAAGARALRPGGTLAYSVCTISRRESNEVVTGFLAQTSDFELDQERRLLPHRDGTDGFYIARLRRAAD
jgi:16S rRNA (cytosine967-C5)-methyltransferase